MQGVGYSTDGMTIRIHVNFTNTILNIIITVSHILYFIQKPAMIEALHHIKKHGEADIVICSDANMFFIEEALKVCRNNYET